MEVIPPDPERLKASAYELLAVLEDILKLTFDQFNNDPVYWAAQRAVFKAFPEKFGYFHREPASEDAPTFTTGHCGNKAQPGGCQLHNLHCAYPACDRRPTEGRVYDATR